MAEKEERIYVAFINPEGDACPVPYGKCNSLCNNCQCGMTRQEAIERMAKAMCKKDFGDCGKCMCRNDDECYTVVEDAKWFGLAEAALNALLEWK